MSLTRLTIASLAGCLIGLLLLAGMTWTGLNRLQTAHREVTRLFELREQLDDFSAASDALLLYGANPPLWQAFRDQALALRGDLEVLGREHPDALRGARQIGDILDALRKAGIPRTRTPRADSTAPGTSSGPLALPLRARAVMGHVAGQGIALDTAVDTLLRQRQQALAHRTLWLGGGFAGAALLFATVCVLAFVLIHRRLVGPIRALSETIRRIGSGEIEARSRVPGRDELAALSSAFDGLADQRQAAIARLEHSQRMLAESQRIAGVGSWRLRLADMHLEWSDETYRILGVDPAGFTPTAEAFLAHVHPDDVEPLLAERERVLNGTQVHDFEFRLLRGDGEIRYVHERAEIEYDTDGAPVYLTGTIQDVTERRELLDHLHQYRRLIEAGTDHFCIVDADHRYSLCNAGFAGLMQEERTALEGRYVADVLGDRFYQREVRPLLERCLAGEIQAVEAERNYPHLGRREVLIRCYPMTSPDGEITHAGVVMTDLTDLKHAEAAVREQGQLLAMAGRVARLGGWSVELPSRRLSWSEVAAEIHGVPHDQTPTVEQVIGFYAPEHRARMQAALDACVDEGEPFDEELQIVDARGARRWVRAVGEPVRDDAANIVRAQGTLQDITADKATEAELARLAERLRTTLESFTDAFFTLDPEWRFTYINAEAAKLLQREKNELLSQSIWQTFPEAVGTAIEREFRRAVAEGRPVTLEEYVEPLETWFDVRAYPSEEGLAVFFRDVTERRVLLARLEARERELSASRDELSRALDTRQTLINALPANVALLNAGGWILDVNDQWRQFGRDNGSRDPGFGIGSNYLSVCETSVEAGGDDAIRIRNGLAAVLSGMQARYAHEYPCHSPDHKRWFRIMANRLGGAAEPGKQNGAVVMHIDVTERKLAERELNRMAYEDALTGLASRNGFIRALQERIDTTGWQAGAAVVVLDVRQQRDINEAHGYAAGDALLQQVGERLVRFAGASAPVARIGGDEFALLVSERDDCLPAERRAAVAAVFSEPFELDQFTVDAAATFGYTTFGAEPREPEDLLREAELAASQSQRGENGGSWVEYTHVLREETRHRSRLTRELRCALDHDQFELHFQPKVDLRDGTLIGCEALLRWRHPERGLQLPGTFIATAERSQLIVPIGAWAINEACRLLSAWQAEGLEIVRVAVNVSLVQFATGDLPEIVRRAQEEHGVAPGGLTLEITESVFERESEGLLRQLRDLHELGVRLSLDDFGTGYSSLLYLQKYPFDAIKVDRGFVQRLLDNDYSRTIVSTVLNIASGLDADAIAEGVESTAMRDALIQLGCHYGQGFYYSMPLENEDFRRLLAKRSSLPLSSP